MRASAQRTACARLAAMPTVISVSSVSRSSDPSRAITGVRVSPFITHRALREVPLHLLLDEADGGLAQVLHSHLGEWAVFGKQRSG
jgi:hypothetical protein